MKNLKNLVSWFDLRGRHMGIWAFVLNRLTALALTSYLIVHLLVLTKLTQGSNAYDAFVSFAQLPLVKVGEILLIAAVLLHGLNGLRLIFLAFGFGVRQQKWLFAFVMVLTLLVVCAFTLRMFGE